MNTGAAVSLWRFAENVDRVRIESAPYNLATFIEHLEGWRHSSSPKGSVDFVDGPSSCWAGRGKSKNERKDKRNEPLNLETCLFNKLIINCALSPLCHSTRPPRS